jgi:hypothetical protein
LPPEGAVIVRKGSLDAAVQAQPAFALTDALPDPAPVENDSGDGAEEILTVQPEAWVTVKFCPAIVRVAVLCGPGLAVTE